MISHQPLRRPARRRHTVVVVQCRETLRDVTSRILESAVQQGAPRLGYLGTTDSSRAKLSQDPPAPSTCSEEEKENLPSSSDPPLSAGLDLLRTTPDPPQDHRSSCSASREVKSPGGSETRIQSDPGETRIQTDPGETRIRSDQGETRIHTDPVETRIQTDPETSESAKSLFLDPPTSSSSLLSETTHVPLTGAGGDTESVSVQRCQQVANELRQAARRAVRLHQQLGVCGGGSERRLQMAAVLQGAFEVVHLELQAALRGGDGRGSAVPSGRLEDDGTMSLLEKYSELLVQMTQNKLNRI